MKTALAAALLLALTSCKTSLPDNVAAVVNGRTISYADLEKRYQAQFGSANAAERPSTDQVQTQRLEVLRTMIDNEILLQRAEKEGLMATDADVEARFAELKAPYTQEEFQKQLSLQHMTAEDWKAQLRRDLSIRKLLNKDIASRISITDQDVRNFYNENKKSFNVAEPQIHMAQILVTANPDPSVHNLKNDKAQNDDQARRKIEMLNSRIRQGEDFAMLAQNYSEDPNTAPNGGDLGFIPESALQKVSPELQKAIDGMTPGQVTPPLHMQEGYRILKLISREPAGQRELNDPQVQQTIRETLFNRRDNLLQAAYYEVARDEARVTNYLAMGIAAPKK
ncbi:MAG TPA: peptidylprolyl isomerase [Bryobacteraceae bacterium]|nr:peptidylprolyl isomerase [Bryobacteraceae bacterium]